MNSKRQNFYSKSSLKSYTEEDILSGDIIKINPALITILDKSYNNLSIDKIKEKVLEETEVLLKQGKVNTLHVDINFEDYSNFGNNGPSVNSHIFNVDFLEELSRLSESFQCFLNIHLLTNDPLNKIKEIKNIKLGAVCFQLEVIKNSDNLSEIINEIIAIGACASPVIEVVGTEKFPPKPKEEILNFLLPYKDKIGMLTFQVESTGSRSNFASGMLSSDEISEYIKFFQGNFGETIQIQGGITISTLKQAIKLGSEFLVCGTEIFNNKFGYSSKEVITKMLEESSKALANKE
ncbi:MAG: hypothetical protein AB6733_10595 [Clostridiaceae bacterium]